MTLPHTDPSSRSTSPAPPQLPEGWRHADDAPADKWLDSWDRRSLWVPLLVALLVGAGVAGLVVLNAAMHYSRGAAALRDHSYALAAAELSSAKLLVLPYRNADALADEARRGLAAETAAEERTQERADAVTAALDHASARLLAGDAPGVLGALQAPSAGDVRVVLRDSPDAREAADALASDLTASAKAALSELRWRRAASFAAALLVLEPSSDEAAALAARARTGEKLSARLAKAKAAARERHWREALRLALAVTAVREGFPGAASVIADARRALAPKPKPTKTATATTTTTPATSSGGTSSGSSSGSSSGGTTQPPPP